jgi:hypothetical protein
LAGIAGAREEPVGAEPARPAGKRVTRRRGGEAPHRLVGADSNRPVDVDGFLLPPTRVGARGWFRGSRG